MALVEMEDLRIALPTPSGLLQAVRGLDIAVEPGETLGIVGESGSGKSMTLLALMGLLPPKAKLSASRLTFDEVDLLTATSRQWRQLRGQRLAMIFQEPMTSLNPAYTLGDQLMEAYGLHRPHNSKAARERAIYLLERVGISDAATRLGHYPHQLSGGLRQRVMIAMALMCDPKLLIADEPTTALDVTIQAQILGVLADLRREFAMAMILVTHDLGIVARVADRVAVMYAGRIVESGPAKAVFHNPSHPYTRGLLSCLPKPGSGRGARLGSIPGVVPALIGELAGCAFKSRCPVATEACGGTIPVHYQGPGHKVHCIHSPSPAPTREAVL
ncbi:MAG: ABC transporter ATP-binding protein [Candidatus Competibacterales bacterium]